MRRVAVTAAVLAALVICSTALAGYQYAPPRKWTPGAGAGTYFSPNWLSTYFTTYGSGHDRTVTFIKNTNYSWHNTRRGTADYIETYPPFEGTYKAHCVSHSYFWGSCYVHGS